MIAIIVIDWPKSMQNKERTKPSPLYSEVNKKQGNDEQAPQNRDKMENKVIYSEVNKKSMLEYFFFKFNF